MSTTGYEVFAVDTENGDSVHVGPYCEDHIPTEYHTECVPMRQGESDTPRHCAECSALLDVMLTDDGYRYVAERLRAELARVGHIDGGSSYAEWFREYGTEAARVVHSGTVPGCGLHTLAEESDCGDGYVEAMVWANGYYSPDTADGECVPLSESPASGEELPEDVRDTLKEHARDFLRSVEDFLTLFPNCGELSPSQMGHDYALTRNGHGAGFWDRGLGELGEYLTAVAKMDGSEHLMVWPDGDGGYSWAIEE